jgi:hypothetical protein
MTIPTDEALDKLEDLIDGLEADDGNFNTWEIDFITDISTKFYDLKAASGDLSIAQRDKIEEIWNKHFDEEEDNDYDPEC